MKLAGWIAAALIGFALAATFMDAPARWLDAQLAAQGGARGSGRPAPTAGASPAQTGRLLASRTQALEEFADRCAPEQWDRAEELRDAAGRAELQGERVYAQEIDEQATALYEEARAEAAIRREEGGCLDQSAYSEMPQPSPRDPEPAPPRRVPPFPQSEQVEPRSPPEDLSSEPGTFPAPELERAPPPQTAPDSREKDDAEVGLRARASGLAGRGDPCAAARLLREQGSSQRSLLLAREYLERCRRQSR